MNRKGHSVEFLTERQIAAAKQLPSPSPSGREAVAVGSRSSHCCRESRRNANAVAKQPPSPSRYLQTEDRGSGRRLAVVGASATVAEKSRDASRGTCCSRKKEIHRQRWRNTTALRRDLDLVVVTLSNLSPA
ncbi:hypothetical protein TIFTF001_023500 [Ficus carica]|uniref:Uncharacterized protein n=1 Tax=Ficus carica TaxID=3494 RepID=A0AA88DFC3_FICCA|nr:hypothetical protein TIFTF001_023500 [Ficus carica]